MILRAPRHTTQSPAERRGHFALCLVLICVTFVGCMGPDEGIVPTFLPTATVEAAPALASIAGTWIGGYQLNNGSTEEGRVSLNFTESANGIEGRIELPLASVSEPLSAVTLTDGKAYFEWVPSADGESGPVVFDGRASGHEIVGTVRRGVDSGSFAFRRLSEPASGGYTQFAGTYRFPSGRAIGFYEAPTSESRSFPTALMYADLQSGDLGAAFPGTGTSFAIGPAIGLAYPFRAEVTFLRDTRGQVSGLTWSEAGSAEMAAERVQFKIEEVTYPSADGEVTLAGRLVSPDTQVKYSAVIIVHGAGPVTRKNFLTEILGSLFALDGIATLSYDKRGVGDSGGTYVGRGNASEDNLELLAKDAIASLHYLKSRPDIDPEQIGMQGNSQAGWIIPLAAAESKEVAFMIMWSGSGVSVGISDYYDDVAEGMSRDEITKTLGDMSPFGFDPAPYLEQVSVPGFWAFGADDKTVPVPESIANLEKIKTSGNNDFTWKVFPGGDHFLLDVGGVERGEITFSRGYVQGLFSETMLWLRGHSRVR